MSQIQVQQAQQPQVNPAQILTDWFAVHARKLPWRENYGLYRTLVSEFMLQQTRVDTVIPYFERWMARWPDLSSLAAADEAEALKLWEGLGYYSRCRNLLKAARALHAHEASDEPITLEVLRSCPGIGAYTAGAVASVGLGLSVPAVDGNAERVIGRFAALNLTTGSPELRREVTRFVTELLEHPGTDARAFNQALMDLGATICTPRTSNCAACPWNRDCQAHLLYSGHETDFPRPRPRPVVSNDNAWGLILYRHTHDGCELLLHRRPASGLWAGMWEIPWCDRTDAGFAPDFATWCASVGLDCTVAAERQELDAVTFSFTTHRVRAWVVALDVSGLTIEDLTEWLFIPWTTLDTLTLPAPSRKFLDVLAKKW